jgi:hypothetical protein
MSKAAFQLDPADVGQAVADALNPGFTQAFLRSNDPDDRERNYQARITEWNQGSTNGPGNSQFGTMLTPEIPYNDATMVVALIVQESQRLGVKVPDAATLAKPTVYGPAEPWNFSYDNGGWGIGGGTPNAGAKPVAILFNEGGRVRQVTGPLA